MSQGTGFGRTCPMRKWLWSMQRKERLGWDGHWECSFRGRSSSRMLQWQWPCSCGSGDARAARRLSLLLGSQLRLMLFRFLLRPPCHPRGHACRPGPQPHQSAVQVGAWLVHEHTLKEPSLKHARRVLLVVSYDRASLLCGTSPCATRRRPSRPRRHCLCCSVQCARNGRGAGLASTGRCPRDLDPVTSRTNR